MRRESTRASVRWWTASCRQPGNADLLPVESARDDFAEVAVAGYFS
jgi:hypothetical protein